MSNFAIAYECPIYDGWDRIVGRYVTIDKRMTYLTPRLPLKLKAIEEGSYADHYSDEPETFLMHLPTSRPLHHLLRFGEQSCPAVFVTGFDDDIPF